MTERYQNGKIYKLVSDVSDDVYYGSTCLPLAKRLYWHKHNYVRHNKEKYRYTTSFKVLDNGLNTVDVVLVEEYPCDNKMELHKRERHYIENYDCVNKVVPCRTKKEYQESHTIEIRNRKNEYRKANKDKISKQGKAYRLANKAKIKEKARRMVTCVCGSCVRKDYLASHRKTIKHRSFETLQGLQSLQGIFRKNMINMCRQFKELLPTPKI